MEEISGLTSLLNEVNMNLRKQRKTKTGSCLSATEVEAFPVRSIPTAQMEHLLSHIHEDGHDFKVVFNLVCDFTSHMMTLYRANTVKELEYVHKPTFQLVKDVFSILIPDYVQDMKFYEKGPGTSIPIEYRTELDVKDSSLEIKGETDLCMRFCEVPLFVLEAKSLLMTFDTPIEKGEVLAETKGFAEQYSVKMAAAAMEFPSLLVSGKVFVFVRRVVTKDEEVVYLMSRPIETFSNGNAMHLENIKLVSKEIVNMVETIRRLIQAVLQRNLEQISGRVMADRDSDGKGDKENNDKDRDHTNNDNEDERGEPNNQRLGHSKGRSLSTNFTTTTVNGKEYSTTTKNSLLTVRNLQKHNQRLLFI